MSPILIILFTFVSIIASAQDTSLIFTVKKQKIVAEPAVVNDRKVFQVVEQMPEYPGGDETMMKFIRSNLNYPDSLEAQHIGGWVVVDFIVKEDGSLSDISIKKSVHPTLDAEATRVVKLFPNFKPGKQLDKSVAVAFVLPIMFGKVNDYRNSGSPTYRDKYPDK
jgi:protein TonB